MHAAAHAHGAQRIVGQVDPLGEHLLAHPVFEETHAARHRRAGNRTEERANQAVRNAPVKDHGRLLRVDLAGPETGNRAFTGRLADLFRSRTVLGEAD